MVLSDCERVAEIRIRGWQTAYRGLMPEAYLEALSVAEDAARRRERFGRGGGAIVNLVAERNGEVVGWACTARTGTTKPAPTASGRPSCTRSTSIPSGSDRGGPARFSGNRSPAAPRGAERMLLWVLEGNTRAHRSRTGRVRSRR